MRNRKAVCFAFAYNPTFQQQGVVVPAVFPSGCNARLAIQIWRETMNALDAAIAETDWPGGVEIEVDGPYFDSHKWG